MIGKQGELHKSNASDHRFFVAKILGVNRMPFKIKGVHEDWLKSKNIPDNIRGISQLAKAIKELEKENQ